MKKLSVAKAQALQNGIGQRILGANQLVGLHQSLVQVVVAKDGSACARKSISVTASVVVLGHERMRP